MLKKTTYATPNRVDIKTGHKTFDRQADMISTGNVWGDVQFSNFIRGKKDVECNNCPFLVGQLQDCDLKHFKDLPQFIRTVVKDTLSGKDSGILYEYRHWVKGHKAVHGYIFTDSNYKLINKWVTNKSAKSRKIIETVLPYVAEEK